MIKIIDKYILNEFKSPFFFGLFIYLTIFIVDIMMGLMNLFMTRDASLLNVVKLFIYNIPALLIIVIPMSVLFSTLMVINNLSGNSEIIVMKGCGISFYRIVIPFFVIGILLSGFSFFVNEMVVPVTNKKVQNVYSRILSQKPMPDIKSGEFNVIEGKNVFFSTNIDKNIYKRNILFEVKNKFPVLILAEKAYIKGKKWFFENGSIYNFGNEGQNFRRIDYETMDTPLFVEKEINTSGSTSKQESFFDLKQKIDELKRAKIDTKKIEFDLYQKTALPFASLVFVLIGAPLALSPVKSGKSIGMGLSILVIFLYYIFMSLGKVLGSSGKITPLAGAWLPNIIFIVLGLILIYRSKN
ncbi:MAG: LptF/LptG family permease [Candidatus Muirbacterium halophilum]|nr:LptF/LptG family permease [Candidatus Muirbacterium halophilum]